ncbi:glycoside hydrolase family 3 N-terminal domain-containing protein [Rhodothermus profundi]|uniref:beta-N-acetylhexosaminidase n=1 Tax=Rhodothermus profundi TaxID=633813 RepID=A0A1M6WEV9_9BACT|nr:glycoside hydrolase family 3 N-terminal domain-containing protein [Rhodothermus profundi]SHK92237.1 beta-glucosidase [Rhodothermus profundi]
MTMRLLSVLLFAGSVTLLAFSHRSGAAHDPSRLGAWTETQLRALTLEQQIGQLFAVRARGVFQSVDDPEYRELVRLVEEFQVGGIIFFRGDPYSQAVLANDLQRRSRLPLLIAQDTEWGVAMRVRRTTSFPRAMAIGATGNPDYAYAVGYVTAREARALGVHQLYAPVADVNNNPFNPIINVRAFGEDPLFVATMVRAFVRGVQDAGAVATAKHFPGHGDTSIDSHSDLPILRFDRRRLDTLELVPFRAAIKAGVRSIMTGHLALPYLDPTPDLPASLSRRITHDLLRNELGFNGLVVTDALEMQGVTKHFGVGEAAVRALEAGADLLLLSEDVEAARAAILQAIAQGRLSRERIEASVRRILLTKEWLGLHRERTVDLNALPYLVGIAPHQALSQTIARASLTLLRNANNLLPLPDIPNAPRRLQVVILSDSDDPATGRFFVQTLREIAPEDHVTARLLDVRSHPEEYQTALRAAAHADVVLVPAYLFVRSGTGRIRLPDRQREFLDALIAQGPPVVLIAFGNPYMIMDLKRPPAVYLAAYGGNTTTQRAVVQALFGQAPFTGRLPITIPGYFQRGDGLQLEQVVPRLAYPEEVGMSTRRLYRIDSLLQAAIAERAFPGAAVAIGRGPAIVWLKGYGHFTYTSDQRVTPESVFDLASLTKVVVTTTAAMQLYEAGQLDLDAPVARYLPAFGQNGKERVTIRQLLSHTAGLAPFYPFHRMGITSPEAVQQAILSDSLIYEPGTQARYSDLGMIVLGWVIERITGQSLDQYAETHIFRPLGMRHTGFRPVGRPDTTIVPTELDTLFRHRLIQGEVHDETAWILGGVAGHAGLFSTAADLARFAYMLVNEGRINGRAFLKPETIRLFTTPVDPERAGTRALGWDTRSPEGYSSAGQFFGPRSFGHTGFTGTSIWIDPDQQLFVILLTNRVYPTRENRKHLAVRAKLADLAYQAIIGPPTLNLDTLLP